MPYTAAPADRAALPDGETFAGPVVWLFIVVAVIAGVIAWYAKNP